MLALGSVAAACALALSEAGPDLTTLGQLGATPAMTRRLMAAQAWLLATGGGLLAAAIGLGPFTVQALASGQLRPRLPIPFLPTPLGRALDTPRCRHRGHPGPRGGRRRPPGPQPHATPSPARRLTRIGRPPPPPSVTSASGPQIQAHIQQGSGGIGDEFGAWSPSTGCAAWSRTEPPRGWWRLRCISEQCDHDNEELAATARMDRAETTTAGMGGDRGPIDEPTF